MKDGRIGRFVYEVKGDAGWLTEWLIGKDERQIRHSDAI
jgi:hypothetical protein